MSARVLARSRSSQLDLDLASQIQQSETTCDETDKVSSLLSTRSSSAKTNFFSLITRSFQLDLGQYLDTNFVSLITRSFALLFIVVFEQEYRYILASWLVQPYVLVPGEIRRVSTRVSRGGQISRIPVPGTREFGLNRENSHSCTRLPGIGFMLAIFGQS